MLQQIAMLPDALESHSIQHCPVDRVLPDRFLGGGDLVHDSCQAGLRVTWTRGKVRETQQ
jgi:hypothetical protein